MCNYTTVLWGVYRCYVLDNIFEKIEELNFLNDNMIEMFICEYVTNNGKILKTKEVSFISEFSSSTDQWGPRHKRLSKVYFEDPIDFLADFSKLGVYVNKEHTLDLVGSYLKGRLPNSPLRICFVILPTIRSKFRDFLNTDPLSSKLIYNNQTADKSTSCQLAIS